MKVDAFLRQKGSFVATIRAEESLRAAVRELTARNIGALVVSPDGRVVEGIVSERDIVRIIAEQGAAGLARPVADCMTREVVFAKPSETIDTILARMTDRRIRHLPVCVDDRLMGIVSIGDLVKAKIAEAEAEAESLRAYIAAA